MLKNLFNFGVFLIYVLGVNHHIVYCLYQSELTDDFRQLIDRIKPEFEENLIRAFKNEAVRNHHIPNNDWYIHKMDNILLSTEDTKIEISKLKFPWIPDFRITSLSVDLNMLYLDIDIKLGDLRVEGEYEANSLSLLKILPVSNVGKIEFLFKDVTGKGKVGLFIRGDSLVPENYDISYVDSESSLMVKYFVNSESEIENKMTRSKDDEDILGKAVWKQLTEMLNDMLNKQLGEAVVQFSVTELLEDEDQQLRDLARQRSAQANRLFDSLLCTAKDFLVAKSYRTIKCAPFDVIYRGKLSGIYQGTLHTDEGYVQDLSTLSRFQDISLFEDTQKLILYGSLTIKDFKHGYDHYNSHFEDTRISGSIKTSVYENKIFIKLSVMKLGNSCTTNLDNVHVTTVRDIDVDASGLASLSWLAPKLESWVIGNLRYSALPKLEEYIKDAFEYAISTTDCVSLLTV